MIGVSWQVEEPMEIGKLNGRGLYVDGAEGIGALAESLGKQHEMQVHVILLTLNRRRHDCDTIISQSIQEGILHVYKANETFVETWTLMSYRLVTKSTRFSNSYCLRCF